MVWVSTPVPTTHPLKYGQDATPVNGIITICFSVPFTLTGSSHRTRISISSSSRILTLRYRWIFFRCLSAYMFWSASLM